MLAGSRDRQYLEKIVATIRNTARHKVDLIKFEERVNDDRPANENPMQVTGYAFRSWKTIEHDLSAKSAGEAISVQIGFEPSEARQAALLLTRECVDDDKEAHGKKIQNRMVASYNRDTGEWKTQWEEQMGMNGKECAEDELRKRLTADMVKPETVETAELAHSRLKGQLFIWLHQNEGQLPPALYRLLVRCDQMRDWCNELNEEEPNPVNAEEITEIQPITEVPEKKDEEKKDEKK